MDDIEKIIINGVKFHKARPEIESTPGKKKKSKKRYINGAHNSGSAKMKAEIRKRRQIKSAKKAARHDK